MPATRDAFCWVVFPCARADDVLRLARAFTPLTLAFALTLLTRSGALLAVVLAQVKHCGFVLVAGGLGERLGYGDIKLRLPSETCTMTTYLQLYIGQILHLQARWEEEREEMRKAARDLAA